MVITTGWALAVFVGVVIAAPYSGAHLNPAVTIGVGSCRKICLEQSVLIYSGAVNRFRYRCRFWYGLFTEIILTEHPMPNSQLAVFCTAPAIHNRLFNLLSEIVGTFVLVFVIFYFTNAKLLIKKRLLVLVR